MKKLLFFILFIFLFTRIYPQQTYIIKLEEKIFKAINLKRKEYNLPPLKLNKKLSEIARNHSRDMAKRNYTSHITPEGFDPNKRAEKSGFNIIKKTKNGIRKGIGENIYETQAMMEIDGVIKYYLEDINLVVKKAVDGWLKSEGHRKNILNPDYTQTGIGVAISKDKKIKITQVFF
jgi:uncharacterized protein YkwD